MVTGATLRGPEIAMVMKAKMGAGSVVKEEDMGAL